MDAEEKQELETEHLHSELSNAELDRQTQQAMHILSAAGVTVRNMVRHLSTVRAQVVTEHYGPDFLKHLDELRNSYLKMDFAERLHL